MFCWTLSQRGPESLVLQRLLGSGVQEDPRRQWLQPTEGPQGWERRSSRELGEDRSDGHGGGQVDLLTVHHLKKKRTRTSFYFLRFYFEAFTLKAMLQKLRNFQMLTKPNPRVVLKTGFWTHRGI